MSVTPTPSRSRKRIAATTAATTPVVRILSSSRRARCAWAASCVLPLAARPCERTRTLHARPSLSTSERTHTRLALTTCDCVRTHARFARTSCAHARATHARGALARPHTDTRFTKCVRSPPVVHARGAGVHAIAAGAVEQIDSLEQPVHRRRHRPASGERVRSHVLSWGGTHKRARTPPHGQFARLAVLGGGDGGVSALRAAGARPRTLERVCLRVCPRVCPRACRRARPTCTTTARSTRRRHTRAD
eukprot:2133473-Prymnesium_polylepis.1